MFVWGLNRLGNYTEPIDTKLCTRILYDSGSVFCFVFQSLYIAIGLFTVLKNEFCFGSNNFFYYNIIVAIVYTNTIFTPSKLPISV